MSFNFARDFLPSLSRATSREKRIRGWALDEEEYVDANFEWSFVEMSDRVKHYVTEDARTTTVKPNLKNPIHYYKMTEAGLVGRPSLASSKQATRASKDSDQDQAGIPLDYAVSFNANMNVEDFIESCDRWTFDIFSLSHFTRGHAMQALAHEIFTRHELLTHFNLTEEQFMRFIMQVERHYKRNPYHNACHAADVLQTVNCIISRTGFVTVMNSLEIFCILLTALVHDIEHTGTNNNFHKNSNSELAKLYVVSVLENHHLRVGLRMLKEYDILKSLSKEAHDTYWIRVMDRDNT